MNNNRRRPRYPRAIALAAIIGGIASGCAVGPDFKTPAEPVPGRYTATPLLQDKTAVSDDGIESQRVATDRELPAEWWQIFHNQALDQLIRQSLADSPTLTVAKATLRQAEENLRAQKGVVYFPALDASFSGTRQKSTGTSFGQSGSNGFTYTLYNASLALSYNLDLFGGGRRELEALQSQVDYQRFQLEAAHVTLTSNIVTAAVKEASLREQLKTTREMLAVQENLLELVQRQFQLGGAARADVLTQETQVAQVRATLPQMETDLAQTRNQLAVYAGKFPGEADLPEFKLEELSLPRELPLSLPSSLARQRPDIRASEELLHAASAQVGVATANLYPQVTLNGSIGSQSATLGKLFSSGTSVWSLAAGLTQPLFRGGELTAKRRAAIAAYDQAAAQYRQVVLQAFQNVADVLQALDSDTAALRAQAETERVARETLDLTRRQYEIGSANYLLLLNAQRQHQQTSISLIQARAARLADSAALFQALGGGWWNRQADTGAGQTAEKKQ